MHAKDIRRTVLISGRERSLSSENLQTQASLAKTIFLFENSSVMSADAAAGSLPERRDDDYVATLPRIKGTRASGEIASRRFSKRP